MSGLSEAALCRLIMVAVPTGVLLVVRLFFFFSMKISPARTYNDDLELRFHVPFTPEHPPSRDDLVRLYLCGYRLNSMHSFFTHTYSWRWWYYKYRYDWNFKEIPADAVKLGEQLRMPYSRLQRCITKYDMDQISPTRLALWRELGISWHWLQKATGKNFYQIKNILRVHTYRCMLYPRDASTWTPRLSNDWTARIIGLDGRVEMRYS